MNIGVHKQKRSVSYSRARFRLVITKRQMTIIMSSQQWLAMCAALMFGLLTVTVEARGQLNARQEDAVQSAFEQMLGLSAPPTHNGGDISHVSGHIRAPRHMLELYERYTRSRKTTGETIRSILPLPDTTISNIAVSDLLLFNVSCLLESRHSEEVTNARLHVRRRRWMAPRHAYHGGSGGQMLAPPARIRVYRVTQTQAKVKMVALASIPVLQATKGGWHSLDITSAVRELLLTSPPHSHTANVTLAVRFDSPRGRPIPPDNFLLLDDRQQSAAFLVVFCRDDDQHDNELVDDDVEGRRKTIDISAEHAEIMAELLGNAALSAKQANIKKDVDNAGKQRHQIHYFKKNVYANKKRNSKIRNSKKYKNKPLILIETSSAADGDINELVSMRNMKAFNKRHHRSGNNLNVRYDETSDKAISNVKSERSNHVMEHNILDDGSTKRVLRSSDNDDNKRRSVRSIEDNELPDSDLIYFDEKTILSKIPLEVMKPTEGEDSNTIPYPTGSEKKSRRRGRKGRKRGNKNKRHRKLPEDWDYWKKGNSEESEEHDISATMTQTTQTNATNNSSFAAAAILQTCHRRRLTVDFYDIGWSDWIIAPESFDAHYCTGRCPFPLAETLKPTNHAIIQSLVHAIGRQMGVPALCCVPDAMSPMPLLYIDEAGNAVLKNYPSMTVDTCACR